MGVLQESVDPLHVSKQLTSAGPLKKTQGPCLISRSLFIHKLCVVSSLMLPSAGNVLFHLCGLCICEVLTERGCGGGVRKWALYALKCLSVSGEGECTGEDFVLGYSGPSVDSSGSMVKDWTPLNSVSHREGWAGSERSGQYFKDAHIHTNPHTHIYLGGGQEVVGHHL